MKFMNTKGMTNVIKQQVNFKVAITAMYPQTPWELAAGGMGLIAG